MLYDFIFVTLVRNMIETTKYDDASQEIQDWISSILREAMCSYDELCDLCVKHEYDRANDTDNSQLYGAHEDDFTRTRQGDFLCSMILSKEKNESFQKHPLAKELIEFAKKRMYMVTAPSVDEFIKKFCGDDSLFDFHMKVNDISTSFK